MTAGTALNRGMGSTGGFPALRIPAWKENAMTHERPANRLRLPILGGIWGLVLCFWIGGCASPDSLMTASLHRDQPDAEKWAGELVEFATDSGQKESLRCWALRSLSRFRKVPTEAVAKLGARVADPREAPQVRAWAAYTLSEWRRKEAIPYFLSALKGNVDGQTAYFALEGLAQSLSILLEDTDLTLQAVKTLGDYAAHQTKDLPSIYNLIDEYISTLTALVMVLDQTLNEEAGKEGSAESNQRVYSAVYRLMVAVSDSKAKLTAAYSSNEQMLKQGFDLAFASTERKYQPVFLMVAWFMGLMGDKPELAALAGDRLVAWATHADPRLRMIAVWSLSRMEVFHPGAADALVHRVLEKETDDNVLALFGVLSSGPDTPDAGQKVLRIETSP